MTEKVETFSHFIVQTLVSESWRSFERYTDEDEAHDIARQLVPDWGAKRVRILGGNYDELKGREVYHDIDIAAAPPSGLLHRFKQMNLMASGTAVGGAVFALFLITYAASATFSSRADESKTKTVTADITAMDHFVGPAREPKTLRDRFIDVAAIPYGKVTNLIEAPIRLRGPWSTACGTETGTLVIDANALGLQAHTAPNASLTSVWQAGQRYGLLLDDGSVYLLDMVSFDQIKPVGVMSQTGDFAADQTGLLLNRCT